jgi:hypothetical protein
MDEQILALLQNYGDDIFSKWKGLYTLCDKRSQKLASLEAQATSGELPTDLRNLRFPKVQFPSELTAEQVQAFEESREARIKAFLAAEFQDRIQMYKDGTDSLQRQLAEYSGDGLELRRMFTSRNTALDETSNLYDLAVRNFLVRQEDFLSTEREKASRSQPKPAAADGGAAMDLDGHAAANNDFTKLAADFKNLQIELQSLKKTLNTKDSIAGQQKQQGKGRGQAQGARMPADYGASHDRGRAHKAPHMGNRARHGRSNSARPSSQSPSRGKNTHKPSHRQPKHGHDDRGSGDRGRPRERSRNRGRSTDSGKRSASRKRY